MSGETHSVIGVRADKLPVGRLDDRLVSARMEWLPCGLDTEPGVSPEKAAKLCAFGHIGYRSFRTHR
jgi:hypothetical protein